VHTLKRHISQMRESFPGQESFESLKTIEQLVRNCCIAAGVISFTDLAAVAFDAAIGREILSQKVRVLSKHDFRPMRKYVFQKLLNSCL